MPAQESSEREVHRVYDARVERFDESTSKETVKKDRKLFAKLDRVSTAPCKKNPFSLPSTSCGCGASKCGCGNNGNFFANNGLLFGQTSDNIPVYAFPDDIQLPEEFTESLAPRQKRSANPSNNKGFQVRTKSLEIQLPKLIPPQNPFLGGIFEPKNKLIAKQTKIVTRNAENRDFIDSIKATWNLDELKRDEKDVGKQSQQLLPLFKLKLPEITNKKIIDLPFMKLNEKKIVTRDIKMDEQSQQLHKSPCGYSYESCDPKVHNKEGCPLCYKCSCEPVKGRTTHDIKIPYQVVQQQNAPGIVPRAQEFDHEPKSFIGHSDPETYKKYIKQIISKYPEHMSMKMPNINDQQRDLLEFINALAKSDTDETRQYGGDYRYKLVDNALDMYKQYEQAINSLPKAGKPLKRESLIEVIPLDDAGKSYAIPRNQFDEKVEALSFE